MKPMSRHVLVTGGAGFIGSHLVERLLADGKNVAVIDDCSTGSLENLHAVRSNQRLKIVQSKVSESGELLTLVENAESIYHLAAAVGVDLVLKSGIDTIKRNLDETELFLRLRASLGFPFCSLQLPKFMARARNPRFLRKMIC